MTKKIIYWTMTGIVALMMIFSAAMYMTNPEIAANFAKMGFQDFFRVELAIAKVIGAIVLLIPMFPTRIREWAFAGFAITFISAFIAHISVGDPTSAAVMPLIMLAFLSVSHYYYLQLFAKVKA